jgi:hypothetical protein
MRSSRGLRWGGGTASTAWRRGLFDIVVLFPQPSLSAASVPTARILYPPSAPPAHAGHSRAHLPTHPPFLLFKMSGKAKRHGAHKRPAPVLPSPRPRRRGKRDRGRPRSSQPVAWPTMPRRRARSDRRALHITYRHRTAAGHGHEARTRNDELITDNVNYQIRQTHKPH